MLAPGPVAVKFAGETLRVNRLAEAHRKLVRRRVGVCVNARRVGNRVKRRSDIVVLKGHATDTRLVTGPVSLVERYRVRFPEPDRLM